MHADDVGPLHQRCRGIDDLDAELLLNGGARCRIVSEPAAPDQHRHAERTRALGDFAADVAEAKQAERLAHQALRLRVFLLVPRPGAQLSDVVGDASIEREDQSHRQLGDRDRILAGAIRHVDAALRRGGHVDGVDAGAGADDQRQRARIHHRLGDLRRSHDEDGRLRLADRGDERVAGGIRLENYFATGGCERVETRLLELVCYQDLHDGK